MNIREPDRVHVTQLRPVVAAPMGVAAGMPPAVAREPLWRDVVGEVLRRERLAQERTLKDVADAARISMPYLSEVERGRKEASSEVLAAAARSLGIGLAELLALAQEELVRLVQERARKMRAMGMGMGMRVGMAAAGMGSVQGGTRGAVAGSSVRTSVSESESESVRASESVGAGVSESVRAGVSESVGVGVSEGTSVSESVKANARAKMSGATCSRRAELCLAA